MANSDSNLWLSADTCLKRNLGITETFKCLYGMKSLQRKNSVHYRSVISMFPYLEVIRVSLLLMQWRNLVTDCELLWCLVTTSLQDLCFVNQLFGHTVFARGLTIWCCTWVCIRRRGTKIAEQRVTVEAYCSAPSDCRASVICSSVMCGNFAVAEWFCLTC